MTVLPVEDIREKSESHCSEFVGQQISDKFI
jgi:hypothetical protein